MAERLGFYSVWGTPPDSLTRYSQPPNFYEVFISLAYVAAASDHIRLGTGVTVIPMREPVLLAKQVATLDVFSGGRLLLGVGLGSLRYEFEALNPSRRNLHRGNMLNEGLEALNILLTQNDATFKGKYYEFQGVSLYPKPIQKPLPIYLSGGNPETPNRIARWCTAWLVSSASVEVLRQRWEQLLPALEEQGRDPSEIEMAAITTLCLGRTHEEAVKRYQTAAMPRRRQAQDMERLVATNFIGTPSELIERISEMEKAGLNHCITQNFAVNTFEELTEQVQMYGEEVLPAFK